MIITFVLALTTAYPCTGYGKVFGAQLQFTESDDLPEDTTVIVLNYNMQPGTQTQVVDPYLRFDYQRGDVTHTGVDHGVYNYFSKSATFNLTTDRLSQPIVYWTFFNELAGLTFMTLRYNFDFTYQYNIPLITRPLPNATLYAETDLPCLTPHNSMITGMRSSGLDLDSFQFIYAGLQDSACSCLLQDAVTPAPSQWRMQLAISLGVLLPVLAIALLTVVAVKYCRRKVVLLELEQEQESRESEMTSQVKLNKNHYPSEESYYDEELPTDPSKQEPKPQTVQKIDESQLEQMDEPQQEQMDHSHQEPEQESRLEDINFYMEPAPSQLEMSEEVKEAILVSKQKGSKVQMLEAGITSLSQSRLEISREEPARDTLILVPEADELFMVEEAEDS
jgi:hypothetical protein